MNTYALIDQAIDLLRGAQRAVALTGAGISTPSGIPDYRSPRSGLWEEVDMMDVATIYAFRKRPQAFYDWLRPLLGTILDAEPNPAHVALADLEAAGVLSDVITQNIDLLHSRAGSRAVHEVHGHLREVVCLACHHIEEAAPHMTAFLERGVIPHCRRCHHVMKPNVILFGELLPRIAMKNAQSAARLSDVMIVAGTSLEVAPAGDLPALARETGTRLIFVNHMETCFDHLADVVIREDVADILPELAAPFVRA